MNGCVYSSHHFPILSDNLLSPDFQARKSAKQAFASPCLTILILLGGLISLRLIDLIVDLEHETDLQVSIGVLRHLRTCVSALGSLSPVCSLLPSTSGCLRLIVLFTSCEDAFQVLLTYHLVCFPVNDVDRYTIDVLKEHIPVLVLRLVLVS